MESNLALVKPTMPNVDRKTYNLRSLKREYAQQRRGLEIVGQGSVPDYWRPKNYEECKTLPRPCPYVGCRYHLLLDETDSGGFKTYANLDDLDKMKETCALDVANQGPKTLDEIGQMMHLTRERVRQLENKALESFNEIADILLEPSMPKVA